MKKSIIYSGILLLFIWIIAFIAFSFSELTVNPFEWNKDVRGGYSCVMGVTSFLVVIFFLIRSVTED